MPKTILQLVTERDAVLAASEEEAERNGKLAARAIIEGRYSLAWREYMLQFVDKSPLNTQQLARLLATDDTLGDPEMDRRRAYLLGNAVCGGGSTGETTLLMGVETIDDGL